MPDWWDQQFPSWEKAQLAWNVECDAFNAAQAAERKMHGLQDPLPAPRFGSWEEAVTAEAQFYAVLGFEASEAVDRSMKWAYDYGYHDSRSPLDRARAHRRSSSTLGGSLIDRIKAAWTVEEVAERITDMRGSGNVRRGRCPFHADKTPSFITWRESQQWRCFGACATGGDVVDLYSRAREIGRV